MSVTVPCYIMKAWNKAATGYGPTCIVVNAETAKKMIDSMSDQMGQVVGGAVRPEKAGDGSTFYTLYASEIVLEDGSKYVCKWE